MKHGEHGELAFDAEPRNDQNDENAGVTLAKGESVVYRKRGFDNPREVHV